MEHFAETTNVTSAMANVSITSCKRNMSMSINKLNKLEAQKKNIGNDSIAGNFVSSSMQLKRSSEIITKRMN